MPWEPSEPIGQSPPAQICSTWNGGYPVEKRGLIPGFIGCERPPYKPDVGESGSADVPRGTVPTRKTDRVAPGTANSSQTTPSALKVVAAPATTSMLPP